MNEEDKVTVQPDDVISTSVGRLETYTDLETIEFFNQCFEKSQESVASLTNELKDSWKKITRQPCRLYDMPTGKIGRQYVELLTEELEYFMNSSTNATSERLIALPSLVLHRDPKVRVAKEAKQLIEQRICKWKNRQFDVLLQSFLRCSKSMPKINSQMKKADRERRFSKWVQNGSVRGAIALLTTTTGFRAKRGYKQGS